VGECGDRCTKPVSSAEDWWAGLGAGGGGGGNETPPSKGMETARAIGVLCSGRKENKGERRVAGSHQSHYPYFRWDNI